MTRRTFLPALAATAAAAAVPAKGRLKQSVTAGVFRGSGMTLDDMCREAAKLGIYGFDLVKPEDWPVLKKHGLAPTMLPGPYGGTIPDGINNRENHDRLEKGLREGIETWRPQPAVRT
jgi:hydroxypyruvate isomerase